MKCILISIGFLLLPAFVHAQINVLIVYHSETGNTRQMAEAVAEGAGSVEGVHVFLKTTAETDEEDLLNAHAIIVGSPVYNANVSPEVQRFITSWPFEGAPLKNKIGAAFVTAGGISAGEELVQMNILQSMLIFGMIVAGGPDWTQPFGASAITGEQPFDTGESGRISAQFLEKGRELGRRVAALSKSLSN
jgi:NAD(P)H dehydrogenase (quinone)